MTKRFKNAYFQYGISVSVYNKQFLYKKCTFYHSWCLFVRNYGRDDSKSPHEIADEQINSNEGNERKNSRPLSPDPVAEAQGVLREFPEEPTTCCMSGCPNCVWLDYADKLSAYFKDGGERAMKELDKISDPNIKAFIMQEWRSRQNKGE